MELSYDEKLDQKYVDLYNEEINNFFVELKIGGQLESFTKDFLFQEGVKESLKRKDKEISAKIDKKADELTNDLKKIFGGNNAEEIIENKSKLSSLLKRAAGLGTAWYINPVLGLLSTFTTIVVRKKIKQKEKDRILNELKMDLEIVEEKIRDAEQDNNRKKKYELMRLRKEINKSIEKIRYANTI